MLLKPTYEELEKKVAALEAESRRLSEVQAELKRSLNFTESLLASIPTPIFYKDAGGRYQGCNVAFTEIMGVTTEQIRGKTVQDLWPGEHASRYHQKDLELMANPRLQVYEFEVKDKQGRIRPVIYYKNVFRDEKGEIAGLVGGFVDISEIRQAQSEQQALFSMSLDMICIADIHTATFLKVNPAFTATLGYSEAELLSVPFTDFIHPEDVEPTRKAVVECLQIGEKFINFKNRYRCKNSEYRWLNWVSHPAPEKGVTYAIAHDITDEIQAYESLRSHRDLLNSLFDSLPMGITIWDGNGRLLMINKGFTDLTGYTPTDIGGLDDWFSIAYPDPQYRRLIIEDWQTAKESAGAREFKVTCRDGRIRDIEFHGTFLKDGRALVTLTDITDRRHAQNEIQQRRQFLESVLYHAPDAIITLDEQHRVIDWNPGAVKMFKYSTQEAIGAQLDDLVSRYPHRDEARDKTTQVLAGRRVEAFETIRYRKDGTPLHVIAAGSPIMIEGKLKGVVAVYTDISGRVRGEEALRTSHHRFITVLDGIDASISVVDLNTHEILFMNRHMIEDFGGDFTGKTCWKAFRGESAPCPYCPNHRLVDASGQPTGVIVWQDKNPVSGKWNMNHDRAIEWTDGRIVRLQIAIDITDYKKMEEALRRTQKMDAIGTLASGIAHDFNNLLMGIQGRTSLIGIDLEPDHPHVEHISAIEEYIRSAVDLTRQLLGFVRGGKYEVKPVDVNELLKSSAAMFGRTHKEICIRTETGPEPLVVEADKRQIEQVLLNIYINAFQAMPDGGNLFLTTQQVDLDENACLAYRIPPGRYVKISLTDTGIGMTAEVQQKVFDPFFTTKQKSRGTGLGLASAYGIIKNHGGIITVYSEFGHGSTFNIYLPSCQREAEAETPIGEELVGGTETILLVDDEEMIVEVGKAMLERLGYRVFTANGGADAIACLSNMGGDIDLVILDLIMPGIDGRTAFNRIREIQPSVPVILSSGYSINGQATEIMERGCNGFIQKPFALAALAQKIRRSLDGPQR